LEIAFTYSGQPRDIQESWGNHRKYLLKPLLENGHSIDIFCHFWHDEEKVGKEYVENSKSLGVVKEDIPMFVSENLKPVKAVFEKPRYFQNIKYLADSRFPHPVERTLSMFASWYEVMKIYSEYEKDNGKNYDLVFRLRTDLIFFNKITEINKLNSSKMYLLNNYRHLDYGVDDTFAISGSEGMKKYYSITDSLDELLKNGAAFNPETLLGFYLCNYLNLDIEKIDFRVHLFRGSYLKFNRNRLIGELMLQIYLKVTKFRKKFRK